MARTVDVGARDALFDDVLAVWCADGGAEPPLRALSEAVGASPGTLLHHFGSKGGLIGRMLATTRARQIDALRAWQAAHAEATRAEALDALWLLVAGESTWPWWRLFMSCYAAGVREPESPYGAFARESVETWLDALAPLAPVRGAAARAWAGAVLALVRGAAFDVLATGDRRRAARGVRSALRALAA